VNKNDSRGRLLVRIGKVTVVRRPLRSMVAAGVLQCIHRPQIAANRVGVGPMLDISARVGVVFVGVEQFERMLEYSHRLR